VIQRACVNKRWSEGTPIQIRSTRKKSHGTIDGQAVIGSGTMAKVAENGDDPGETPPIATTPTPRIAEFLAAASRHGQLLAEKDPAISHFTDLYRELILFGRGMHNSAIDADRTRMLLHGMVGARTLGEGINIYAEFIPMLFTGTRAELRIREDATALIFHEQYPATPEGLIYALWPLIVAATELEFLAQDELPELIGHVKNPPSVSRPLANLLFPRHLVYQAAETALVIPAVYLKRSVMARAADVGAFVANLFIETLKRQRGFQDVSATVADMIRFSTLRGEAANQSLIAEQMGCSVAALRRRLTSGALSFREIKAGVLDDLAKSWLAESGLTIEEIAARLGYSDGYSFRRAFRRRNAMPPQRFRELGIAPLRTIAARRPIDGPVAALR